MRKTKKLLVLDFDDTMAKTKARVFVNKSNGQELALTPAEYAVYSKEPGDVFDYSEFDMLVHPKENRWVTNILRYMVAKHGMDSAVILTARGSSAPVAEFLHMFQLPKIPIVALGDSHPDKKKQWILYVAKKIGYDVIEFFDDSHKNIKAVQELSDLLPSTKIITRHIRNQ
jgi:hypothetical protein